MNRAFTSWFTASVVFFTTFVITVIWTKLSHFEQPKNVPVLSPSILQSVEMNLGNLHISIVRTVYKASTCVT